MGDGLADLAGYKNIYPKMTTRGIWCSMIGFLFCVDSAVLEDETELIGEFD